MIKNIEFAKSLTILAYKEIVKNRVKHPNGISLDDIVGILDLSKTQLAYVYTGLTVISQAGYLQYGKYKNGKNKLFTYIPEMEEKFLKLDFSRIELPDKKVEKVVDSSLITDSSSSCNHAAEIQLSTPIVKTKVYSDDDIKHWINKNFRTYLGPETCATAAAIKFECYTRACETPLKKPSMPKWIYDYTKKLMQNTPDCGFEV